MLSAEYPANVIWVLPPGTLTQTHIYHDAPHLLKILACFFLFDLTPPNTGWLVAK